MTRPAQMMQAKREGVRTTEIARRFGVSVASVYLALSRHRAAEGTANSGDELRELDGPDDETPREARARVARELEQGLRCRAPGFSGRPCSLLLPCHGHK